MSLTMAAATEPWVTSGEYADPVELEQLDRVELDFPAFLRDRLSDADKREFATRGYLIVKVSTTST